MSTKKETEDKLLVKPFKDGRMSWWVNQKHYYLDEGEIKLAAGGLWCELEVAHLKRYLKIKKMI